MGWRASHRAVHARIHVCSGCATTHPPLQGLRWMPLSPSCHLPAFRCTHFQATASTPRPARWCTLPTACRSSASPTCPHAWLHRWAVDWMAGCKCSLSGQLSEDALRSAVLVLLLVFRPLTALQRCAHPPQSSTLYSNNVSKFLTSLGPFTTGKKDLFMVDHERCVSLRAGCRPFIPRSACRAQLVAGCSLGRITASFSLPTLSRLPPSFVCALPRAPRDPVVRGALVLEKGSLMWPPPPPPAVPTTPTHAPSAGEGHMAGMRCWSCCDLG